MKLLYSICIGISFLINLVGGDMPTCGGGVTPDFSLSPYCLPDDYNKDIVPPTDGKPLHINVDIWVFEVSKIDDIALSMTFELYFDLTWKETRLVLNETSPEWSPDGVMGSTNFIQNMWLPDIQILNLKQFQKRNIVTDVAGLIIFEDRRVLYTVSTEAVISCPMKFSAYPLDYQECKFNVGSYIHDATQIYFTGTFGHDVENQRAQQYEINITSLDAVDTTIVWANRNYSQTGFKINLMRRRAPVLLQVYLPSGLFVIVSWISFIVPPEVVPGRMALLVTLFLVLVNIFNSVTANAPKAEGLTAVETWVVMCILHVFCVLSEYAIILKIIQTERRRIDRTRKRETHHNQLSSGLLLSSQSPQGQRQAQGKFPNPRGRNLGIESDESTPFEQIFEDATNFIGMQNRENIQLMHRYQHGQRKISLKKSFVDRNETSEQTNEEEIENTPVRPGQHWGSLEIIANKQTGAKRSQRKTIERIDQIAMYLFPIFFFLFNILYWSYYLILIEHVQNLW